MKIYDSLTQNIKQLDDDCVSIYNCGPTVYNDIHIGNARPSITFDVLHRLLILLNKKVQYLHNITDIDDKIIKKANELNTTETEISEKYYHAYLDILKQLNIKLMSMPKVSDNIDGIIDYVDRLVKTGVGYVTQDGDVYFSVRKIPAYGELSHQNIQQLLNGVRNETKENKKDPLDFALWKKTNIGLNWDAPWSKGRPGWHTECSFLINKNIGEVVTIHGGGIDLKFPHHENENAQNYALTKKGLAKIWMHVGHINVNNEKMAKSVGNFILVKDILKTYEANVLRWFIYQTKYENPINYSVDLMNQSDNDLKKVFKTLNNAFIQMYLNDKKIQLNKAVDKEFIDILSNDLDFPNAIKHIWTQAKSISTLLQNKQFDQLLNIISYIKNELDLLGIIYNSPINDKIESLLNQMKLHLKNKDFKKSDEIRDQLIKMGLI